MRSPLVYPFSGQKTLSGCVTLTDSRFAFLVIRLISASQAAVEIGLRAHRYLACVFVIAQSEEHRVTQFPIFGTFAEGNLPNQFRSNKSCSALANVLGERRFSSHQVPHFPVQRS